MTHRIAKLLKILKTQNIDYYLLSTSDEFLNEYVPPENKRLEWITNFSGSNAIALISSKKKFFFTDGRYFLQSKNEISKSFKIFDINKISFGKFLKENLKNKKIMLDMKTFSKDFILKVIENLKTTNTNLIHDKLNLIDKIWENKLLEKKSFFFLDKKMVGQNTSQKIKRLEDFNPEKRILIITSPESVCWLLNIRGYDIEHTPLVLSRLIIKKGVIELFIDKKKLPLNYKKEWNSNISVFDINEFETRISSFSGKRIYADSQISYYFFNILKKKNKNIVFGYDYCKLLKSQKNETEIKYSKKAHISDAVALTKFYTWLEKNKKKKVTEFFIAKKLEKIRQENTNYFSPSFPTIAATGPNASIIHYKPKKKSSVLRENHLFLCDSGGQYYGATTDITRTVFLGNKAPKNLFRDIYTKVLIGHINISMLKFPIGTKGHQIDTVGRIELWKSGLDYNHGTGHGVGSFLGVHEGPQSISKNFNKFDLKPGMIISNEPGYYRDKKFGVRIENLILVKKSKKTGFLEFETLSLFPYEKKLIKKDLLSEFQIKWLNNYHKNIYSKISPLVGFKEKEWLKKKTLPL